MKIVQYLLLSDVADGKTNAGAPTYGGDSGIRGE